LSVHLPSTNAGASWDFGGGAPDPYLTIQVDGVTRSRTSAATDVFDATFSDGNAVVDLAIGSTFSIQVWDEDTSADDFAFTCSDTFTAPSLRSRGFQCDDDAGGGGSLVLLVTPL